MHRSLAVQMPGLALIPSLRIWKDIVTGLGCVLSIAREFVIDAHCVRVRRCPKGPYPFTTRLVESAGGIPVGSMGDACGKSVAELVRAEPNVVKVTQCLLHAVWSPRNFLYFRECRRVSPEGRRAETGRYLPPNRPRLPRILTSKKAASSSPSKT